MTGKMIHEMDAEERDAFSEAVTVARGAYGYSPDDPWNERKINRLLVVIGRELLKRNNPKQEV